MVVSCGYHIHRSIEFDLNWYLFNSFSSECAFVVAAKGIDLSFSGEHNSVKCSTCYLVDIHSEQRIINYFLAFRLVFIIFYIEFLNFWEADGSFGFIITIWVIVLIWLTRSINKQLQFRFFCGLKFILFWWLITEHTVDAIYMRFI